MDEILSRTRIDLAKPILSVLKINLDFGWRELGESYFNYWLSFEIAPGNDVCFQYSALQPLFPVLVER